MSDTRRQAWLLTLQVANAIIVTLLIIAMASEFRQ